MSKLKELYDFLLTEFEPLNAEEVADKAGWEIVDTRTALARLSKNKKIKIKVTKFEGSRRLKKLNTYLLLERKAAKEIFRNVNQAVLIELLNKSDVALSYETLATASNGDLSVRQVKHAIVEIVRSGEERIIKTMDGNKELVSIWKPEVETGDKEFSLPVMSVIDLLFSKRASEAVFKHNLTRGL